MCKKWGLNYDIETNLFVDYDFLFSQVAHYENSICVKNLHTLRICFDKEMQKLNHLHIRKNFSGGAWFKFKFYK